MSEINFFSEADMTMRKDGTKRIASEYPIWYNRQMFDDIQEDINMAEFEINSGNIPQNKLSESRSRLKRLKEKMEMIESSLPKLEGKELDRMAKARKDLGKEISAKMYSRSDMKKGIADSHDEVRRMTTPSIPVTSEISEMAKACNVPITNGKISRTQAEKIWKITGRYLNESSNSESLRRD